MGLCSREPTRRAEIHLWAPRRPGWWVVRGSRVLSGFWLCCMAKRSHKDSTAARIVQNYGLMFSPVPCTTERERLQAEYMEIKPIFQCNNQTMVPAGEW